MNSEILDLFLFIIAITSFAAVWSLGLQACLQSRLRDDMFRIRDDLFDMARSNKYGLTFESEFYKKTRAEINLMIRTCHEVSFLRVTICSILLHKQYRSRLAEAQTEKAHFSDDEKKVLALIDARQSKALMRFLLRSSPTVWIYIALLVFSDLRDFAARISKEGLVKICQIAKTFAAEKLVNRFEFAVGQEMLLGPAVTDGETSNQLCHP